MTAGFIVRLCDRCSDPIDPDEDAHFGHAPQCARVDCVCDLWWHSECCPDCEPDPKEVDA